MRGFLDTNVLISAILRPEGPPGRILTRLYKARFELVTSAEQLAELRRTLTDPRLRARLRCSAEELERWVGGLEDLADVVEDVPEIEPTSRDADDDRHLAAAAAGRADVLVTGDDDLLSLQAFEGVQILTPAAFLAQLDQARPG